MKTKDKKDKAPMSKKAPAKKPEDKAKVDAAKKKNPFGAY